MKGVINAFFLIIIVVYQLSAQSARSYDTIYPGYLWSGVYDGNSRNVLDTVFYPVFGDECALEAVTVGIEGWGRISGMNFFGDLEKAQLLEFQGSDQFQVVAALVFFEKPGIVGNSAVNCKIYDRNPETGAPRAVKGFSNAVRMTEIQFNESRPVATAFSFEDGVEVNLTESRFFVSVDLSNLYASRDTLVVLQTVPDCGDGSNTWELHNDGVSWYPISSFSTWGINADFLMTAVVDFNDPTNVNDYISSNDLRLYPASPNPVSDKVWFNFSLDTPNPVEISVFDQQGHLIHRSHKQFYPTGRHAHEYYTGDLPGGLYYYRLHTPGGTICSRFILNR